LLAAARRVFGELGYVGATVDDIARAAGCSKGAFYFHFASKDEAFVALLEDWIGEASESLTSLARLRNGSLGLDAIEALLAGEVGRGWEPRLVLEFWSQAGRVDGVRARLAEAEERWKRLLTQAIEGAQRSGVFPADVRPDAAAATALALGAGLLMRACLAQAGRLPEGAARAALVLSAAPRPLAAAR
jgi:AcrR family transcriptional regulator